jgi:hypothetical protein
MDKQQLLEKTTETLRPFETANLMSTIQTLTLQQIFSHPAVLITIVVVFFLGVVKRSKTVLLTLFGVLGLIVLMRYAMPTGEEELTFKALLPFIGIGITIGGVVIYFMLIKSD